MSKFVGESEKGIRELFIDAENDQKTYGSESELHVIIFDEFDAIAKQRGSTRDGTGVHDSIVNQLLSKIDGVNSLDNILLIAMTNRIDILDKALLRPGRFEVQIEIGLPDQKGRLQILNVHTKNIIKNNHIEDNVSLEELSYLSKNYTGAELEGLVKSASSYAFNKCIKTVNGKIEIDSDTQLKITKDDFLQGLSEIHPAYGHKNDYLERNFKTLTIYSERYGKMISELQEYISIKKDTQSILLEGSIGSGKSTIVSYIAKMSDYSMIKTITPDTYIGFTEYNKASAISEIFEESYRSKDCLIIIEDFERLVEYSKIGLRYSNQVLQCLLVYIRKKSKIDHSTTIIVTSKCGIIADFDMFDVFTHKVKIP